MKNSKDKIKEMIDNASSLEIQTVWLPQIMRRQTIEERESGACTRQNGKGLNKFDSEFLTSIWDQVQSGKILSSKQIEAVKRILPKYHAQYASMMGMNDDTQQKNLFQY